MPETYRAPAGWRRRFVALAALVLTLGLVAMAGPATSAHAQGENAQAFCLGVWLAPYGQSGDRCWSTGQYLTAVWARSYEASVCVDAAQNGNLVKEWACAPAGYLAAIGFDGSRWLNGVVRNNRFQRTYNYEGFIWW